MSPIFFLLAAMTVGGGIGAVALRNPVHCALSLVVAFVGLAGFYLGLGAQFLGLAQVLVYVGAVAILIVFVMLLTRGDEAPVAPDGERSGRGARVGWGLAVGGLVAGVLLLAVFRSAELLPEHPAPTPPTVRDIGESLMTDYVLPLQGVGVLLTAALIGAALIALPERRPSRPAETRLPR